MSTDKEKAPETLSIFVSDTVKTKEVPPGTPALDMKEREESLPPEEVEKRRKIMLEYTRLSGRYCEPHNVKSKWVEDTDLPRVLADGKDLVAMCNLPRGKYSGIAALSHPQIDNKNPLRFFVLPNGMVVINPVIIKHTKVPLFKNEACMSYPDKPVKTMVPRYNKITVTYQTLSKLDEKSDAVLSNPITEELSGGTAHVFQHKIAHLNGNNLYDEDFDPIKCVGLLGNDDPIDQNLWKVKIIKK
jgi:peptide deformylase